MGIYHQLPRSCRYNHQDREEAGEGEYQLEPNHFRAIEEKVEGGLLLASDQQGKTKKTKKKRSKRKKKKKEKEKEKEKEKKENKNQNNHHQKKLMNLTSLPVEVIELIAGYVAIQLPFQPPSSLINFIMINKHIYRLLSPEQNDQLYATIFRNLFDVKALERRLRAFPISVNTTTTFIPPSSNTEPTLPDRSHQDTHPKDKETIKSIDQNQQVDKSDGQIKNTSHSVDRFPGREADGPGSQSGGGGGTSGGDEELERGSAGVCTGYSDQATEHKPTTTGTDNSELCNSHLASAYFERLGLFQRMRTFAAHPAPIYPDPRRSTDLEPYKDQPYIHQPGNRFMTLISRDLWLIYLMVLENDGRNWFQLLKSGNITGFLLNYFHYEINPSAISPGYPIERPEIAIALRLCHLFLDLQPEESESQSGSASEAANYWTSEAGIETYLFALKPYTLAAHQYDVAYAPWSIRQLPIDLSSEAVLQVLSQKLTPREQATLASILWDLSPEEQATGRLNLLSNQATVDESTSSEPSPHSSSPADQPSSSSDSDDLSVKGYSELTYMGKLLRILPPLHSHVALLSFFWCNIRHNTGSPQQAIVVDDQLEFFLTMMRSVLKLTSVEYDREFVRQTSCLDPFLSPGLHFDFYRDCFRGGWDGQFGFFDLSSYRQMLDGRIESVYEGRYGDQNQVFKVQEFIVRVRDNQPVEFLSDSRKNYLQPRHTTWGSSDAGSDREKWHPEEPMESEIKHLGLMKSLLYPVPIDSIPVKYDPSEEYELQIHGAGHSSWGHFKVKGRVRAWDGMVTFLKIYDTGRHGRWLYRGYHASGNMIVGRWRDTLTSEAADGYEGTFVMFTRN